MDAYAIYYHPRPNPDAPTVVAIQGGYGLHVAFAKTVDVALTLPETRIDQYIDEINEDGAYSGLTRIEKAVIYADCNLAYDGE